MLIDTQLQSRLTPELEPGEEVRWAGQPAPLASMASALPALVFGIAWSGFMVNFMVGWYGVPMHDVSGPGGLFGFHGILASLFFIPFIAIGIGMLVSPLLAYLAARATVYGITDRRVLIVKFGYGRRVQSFGKADISKIERTERANGSGNLAFAQESYRDSDGDRRIRDVRFLGIPEVRGVERILRETFAVD